MTRFLAYILITAFITACGCPEPAQASEKAQSIQFLLSQVRASGVVLAGGTAGFYRSGSSPIEANEKTIWLDRNKATVAANPYTLDANGTAALFGDGLYRVVIKDSAGVTKYDRDGLSFKDHSSAPYVTVLDSGAVPNDGVDDKAAFQAAWNAVTGDTIHIPAGTFRLTGGFSGRPVVFQGMGAGQTILEFENMAGLDGVTFTTPTAFGQVGGFRDLTIVVKGANGRYAVTTPRGSSIFALSPQFVFERVVFKGGVESATLAGLFDYGWERYINLGDSRGTTIHDVQVFGAYDYRIAPGSTNSTHVAFYLSGLQSQGGVLTPQIDHCYALYTGTAVEFGYRVSNPFITNSQFHRVYRGIYSPNLAVSGADYGVFEPQIHNLNINAQRSGIYALKSAFWDVGAVRVTRANGGYDHSDTWYGFFFSDVDDLKLRATRSYNEGAAYTNDHIGYWFELTDFLKISDAHATSSSTSTLAKGMVIKDVPRFTLQGYSANNATVGLSLDTDSAWAPDGVISGDSYTSTVTTHRVFDTGVTRQNLTITNDDDRYTGVDATVTVISAAGTTTLIAGTDKQVKRLQFNAGAGAYTYDIVLSDTGDTEGDKFVLHIALTSANPTVRIMDGTGGVPVTQLTLQTGAPTKRYRVEIVSTGGAWRVIGASESLI